MAESPDLRVKWHASVDEPNSIAYYGSACVGPMAFVTRLRLSGDLMFFMGLTKCCSGLVERNRRNHCDTCGVSVDVSGLSVVAQRGKILQCELEHNFDEWALDPLEAALAIYDIHRWALGAQQDEALATVPHDARHFYNAREEARLEAVRMASDYTVEMRA